MSMGISVSGIMLLLGIFLLIVAVGVIIITVVANKKWGYTEKREKELEKIGNDRNGGGL